MIAAIVGGDEAREPAVRLRLSLGFMEMIERLVRVLHGPERPLDLAFRARRCPAPVRAGGHVRQDLDAEAFHHALEHRRLRDRPVVETDRGRNALEWVPFVARLRLLGRHGVEQEAERRLDILAIDAAVFLVGDARAIIHDREQHQGGRTLPIRVDPGRRLQVLQVRRAHVEVPQCIRALRLEAHGRRLAYHPLVIVAEAPQVAVDRRGRQLAGRQLLEAIRRLDAVLDQQLQGAHRRQVTAFLVGGPHLHGGDDLAPALDLVRRHRAWTATIGAVRILRPAVAAQQAVQRGPADRVQLRRGRHQGAALGMPRRQRQETTTQGRKRFGRHAAAPRHHAPAVALERREVGGGRERVLPPGAERCVPSSRAWPAAFGAPSPLT